MKMLSKCAVMAVGLAVIAHTPSGSRIVIDIRKPSSYGKSHVKSSVNLLTSNLLLRRLQRGSLTIRSLLPENIIKKLDTSICYDTIVIYDEDSTTENESRRITVIGSALKQSFPKKTICYLNGGFNEFCESYPSQCEFDYPVDHPHPFQISINDEEQGNDPTDRNIFSPDTDVCPVSILPFLYLGNAHHSSQKELLDRLGVTAILNVSRSCPVFFRNSYEYKTIPIDDNDSENISSHFDEAIKFIDDIKAKNGQVLVHCRAGISRSATICIAYLIRKYGYTLDQAYEFTKKKRANISPNFNFLGQLLTLETEVLTKQTFEMKCPATVSLPLTIDTKKGPLTSGQLNKTTQLFTYSPKSCMNFFNISNSGNMSPLRVLLTPS